jgi:hypothetical protein
MKSSLLRLCLLVGAAMLTLMMAHGVANACSDYITPNQESGGWSCSLDSEGGGYCYYTCDCGSLSTETCNDRLHAAGFEIEGIDY